MSFRAKLAVAWTLLILFACWSPNSWFSSRGTSSGIDREKLHLDKIVHVVLFAGMSYLWMGVGSHARQGVRVFAGGVFLAVLSELGQAVLPIDRMADPNDVVADTFGVLLGIWIFQKYPARFLDGPRAKAPDEALE